MGNLDPSLKPLEIMEVLSGADKDGMGVTTLSEKTGLSKSTVYRLANALVDGGYLLRNNTTKKYKIGYRILRITSSLTENIEVKEIASPFLIKLSEKTRETVHLVQQDGLHGIYIDKIDSLESVGLLSKVGNRIMLHCTGAGKVLLAYLPNEVRERIYTEIGFPRMTENTIQDAMEMEKELAKIRNLGYGFDIVENREGIHCIAGPIFNSNGKIIASFSVSGPSYRFTREVAESLTKEVIETSEEISRALGMSI